MNTEIDIRRGATSASSAQADLLCAGRHLAQKIIPEKPAGPDAEFGRAIHLALADSGITANLNALTGEQRDIFDSCREIEKNLAAKFFEGDPNPNRVFREQRYWCMVDKKYEHSAQPDVVIRAGTRGLIMEYKTLAGEVDESTENQQLRDQVVLAAGHLILKEVGAAVIQPLVTHTPLITLYDAVSIKQAQEDMFDRVRKSNDPNSPRTPGDLQCKYCRARSTCKEYSAWSARLLPATVTLPDVPVAAWTPEQLALFCERKSQCAKWLEECEQTIKDLLAANPEAVPGWYLKPGNSPEKIVDAQSLFNRYAAVDGTLDQFMKCISVTKGKFEEQLRSLTGLKGKELKSKLDELLAGLVESRQNAPSLAKKK